MTIPSPSSLHFRYGRAAVPEAIYPSMDDFYRDLGTTYRKAVRAFADAGCRYLQLDEVNFTYLCDPELRAHVTARGDDPEQLPHIYARMINAAISDIPADMTITMHLCRGNFQSTFVATGGYEPVAEILFNDDQGQRLFHGIRHRARRRLRAAALRAEGQDRGARASSPPRAATLESKDELKRRIDEAAKYVQHRPALPRRRNAASPRPRRATSSPRSSSGRSCAMIVELSEEVWGR